MAPVPRSAQATRQQPVSQGGPRAEGPFSGHRGPHTQRTVKDPGKTRQQPSPHGRTGSAAYTSSPARRPLGQGPGGGQSGGGTTTSPGPHWPPRLAARHHNSTEIPQNRRTARGLAACQRTVSCPGRRLRRRLDFKLHTTPTVATCSSMTCL